MIQYNTVTSIDDILSPVYFGYMTYLMEGQFNLPENCHKDFPQYMAPKNIEFPNYKPTVTETDHFGAFTVPTHNKHIFERTLLCKLYENICSPDPKNMQMGLATIIRNSEKGAKCSIRWAPCDELYDYIMILRAAFGTVEIGREWINCRDFHLSAGSIDKIMNYFRYALDCSDNIYPFKCVPDRKKLDMIFKKLFE